MVMQGNLTNAVVWTWKFGTSEYVPQNRWATVYHYNGLKV